MDIKLDVNAVVDYFGGITPLHDKFVHAGFEISRKAIEKWKERESIPTSAWLQIEAMAAAEGQLMRLRNSAIQIHGDLPGSSAVDVRSSLKKAELLRLYREMVYIRRFEEKAGQLYGMGLIGGFCHLYIGQEAIAVGMQSVTEPGDSVITTYRDHGLMLSTGSSPESILGELMGRANGCSKGKGGSMHMFDTEKGFYGGHGIVGASVPLGAGLAFASKYRGKNNICLSYFGDGAANQGQVYETFNMAALWQLPVIFIIENNGYAMGTSVQRSSSTTELYRRGEAFGIVGRQVDGMDIFAVMEAGKEAVDYVRSGKGPIILEMKTYRYRGHSMSDPAKYRSKEEVSDVKENRDAIEYLKRHIIDGDFADEAEIKAIDKEIRQEIAEVVDICKAAPEPDESELWTDVYND
jgi:pyruvate dehydrogenase E1 component alpha subunit